MAVWAYKRNFVHELTGTEVPQTPDGLQALLLEAAMRRFGGYALFLSTARSRLAEIKEDRRSIAFDEAGRGLYL